VDRVAQVPEVIFAGVLALVILAHVLIGAGIVMWHDWCDRRPW
jgi:hypothetical protein